MIDQRKAVPLMLLGTAMLFTGCYTVLMRPGTDTENFTINTAAGSSATREINFSDDCTSCHSEAELADRSYDASKYHLQSVHGIAVDPYGWKSPKYSSPWWNPQQQSFIPIGAGTVPTTTTAAQPERRRTSGSTRGDETVQRPAGTGTAGTPTPITTVTPRSTSSTPSAPSAATGAQIAPSTTPATQTAPAQTNSGGERRRTAGSTRGDEK